MSHTSKGQSMFGKHIMICEKNQKISMRLYVSKAPFNYVYKTIILKFFIKIYDFTKKVKIFCYIFYFIIFIIPCNYLHFIIY